MRSYQPQKMFLQNQLMNDFRATTGGLDVSAIFSIVWKLFPGCEVKKGIIAEHGTT